MEKDITNKIQIMFTIDVPDEIGDSDFNSLILRANKLKYSRKNTKTLMDVNLHNRNIEEMQKLLENFKVKIMED